ncbi:MAG: hypothetical protein EWM50_07150 [Gottschalkiaceae bacterium]|nr:MAG: hypothetical protein EWM50_07150 [Gottschalkiaceae bacterium]
MKFNGAESSQSSSTWYVQLVGVLIKNILPVSGVYCWKRLTFAVTGAVPQVDVNVFSCIENKSLIHPNQRNSTLNIAEV